MDIQGIIMLVIMSQLLGEGGPLAGVLGGRRASDQPPQPAGAAPGGGAPMVQYSTVPPPAPVRWRR